MLRRDSEALQCPLQALARRFMAEAKTPGGLSFRLALDDHGHHEIGVTCRKPGNRDGKGLRHRPGLRS